MKHKIALKAPDELWDSVKHYAIDSRAKNNNEAVLDLIRTGLKEKRRQK